MLLREIFRLEQHSVLSEGRATLYSQSEAKYVKRTISGNKCKKCKHFKEPHKCKIVSGRIEPDGTCLHFKRKLEENAASNDSANPPRTTTFKLNSPLILFRGDASETNTAPQVKDGLLGPGRYLTGDESAAQSYGPHVSEYVVSFKNPIVIELSHLPNADPSQILGKIAEYLYEHTNFFMTKGSARRWAREQAEDYSGIGDEDFLDMLQDAKVDGVVLLQNGVIVEANVPFGPLKRQPLSTQPVNSVKEDAAGVGTITKQNTTKDVGPGTLRKNLQAFRLIKRGK